MSEAPPPRLRLATRGSALARAQTALAEAELRAAGAGDASLVVVTTTGDRNAAVPLGQLEGEGWFTAELERALLEGRADVAVHSAKDLPTELAPGLAVAALLIRGDPRDALVSSLGARLADLPGGATVGTSSARRAAYLAAGYPHLRTVPMRGNVDTRLSKLDGGQVDALLLAAAGLDRLGLGHRAGERLDPTDLVPAPAQGAIALEVVAGTAAADLCAAAGDAATTTAVRAERAVLAALGGGCLLPLGAFASLQGGSLVLSAALAGVGEVRRAQLGGDPAEPERLGRQVADRLR